LTVVSLPTPSISLSEELTKIVVDIGHPNGFRADCQPRRSHFPAIRGRLSEPSGAPYERLLSSPAPILSFNTTTERFIPHAILKRGVCQ